MLNLRSNSNRMRADRYRYRVEFFRQWRHLLKWCRAIGSWPTLYWLSIRLLASLGGRGPKSWCVRSHWTKYPMTARLRGSSDMKVIYEIFVEEEYSSLRSLPNVSLILDLGANVGYSSAYFLSCFPGARVVAVEPDDRNFAICSLNLKPFAERAILLNGAVWSDCTKLSVSKGTFGDGREWATEVVHPLNGCEGDIQAWDVGSLIEMGGCPEVDLLKIDIEGAERTVFGQNAAAWLPKVRNLCIELHGLECRDTFFKALAEFDYELSDSGGLTICKDIRPKQSGQPRTH